MAGRAGGQAHAASLSCLLAGIYGACIVVSALLCTFGRKFLVYFTEFGAVWHLIGVLIVTIAIPIICTYHQPSEWVSQGWVLPCYSAASAS